MTKGREIIIFGKSQPPFDVHRQYLEVQYSAGWNFKVSLSNFHCFVDFLKI